jgi:hypothetical protein
VVNPRKATGFLPETPRSRVEAAAGCDLLILLFKIKIKRSQPAAAPTATPTNVI